MGGFYFQRLVGFMPSQEFLEELYAEHKGKAFYDGTLAFMSSDHNYLCHVEKDYTDKEGDIIVDFRKLIGKTIWKNADRGTIRGDLGRDDGDGATLIHTPDSVEARDREADLIDKFVGLNLKTWLHGPR